MARPLTFNGMTAAESGYWTDRHGHRVFVCRGDLLPSCPRYPFATTEWMISAEVGCQHEIETRRAA